MDVSAAFGVTAHVYQGLLDIKGSSISSECRDADLVAERAKAVFVVLPYTNGALFCREYSTRHINLASDRGVPLVVYGVPFEGDMPETLAWSDPDFPEGVQPRMLSNFTDFEALFRKDIERLMAQV